MCIWFCPSVHPHATCSPWRATLHGQRQVSLPVVAIGEAAQSIVPSLDQVLWNAGQVAVVVWHRFSVGAGAAWLQLP
jgi:hypothetical protein